MAAEPNGSINLGTGTDTMDIEQTSASEGEPVALPPGKNLHAPRSLAMAIVVAAIVSLVSSVGSIVTYDRFFAQKVVTANISKFVIDQRELYFQGKIDKQQYINSLTNFIALLKNQPKNKVIILEDVVAANAEKLEPR
ncbi:MAG: hypothetical protein A4E63_02386 [Syntrophorhabdus sp. PtaU1.Bin050]|nr:MAG: hypothetical protein A4E63_02386 [Syntrophorhabdus sp. PtaU1.Bin050]